MNSTVWTTIGIVAAVLAGLVLLGGGYAAYEVVPQMMADMFNNPIHQPMPKTPADYGLEYEVVRIETEDGVTIAAWLIRGKGDDTIILGHPGTYTKYGYSLDQEDSVAMGYDRDIEFVPAAKHLVEAGYSVLLFDQRNHGESEDDPRGIHDAAEAYWDTLATAEYVASHPDFAGGDIGLFSNCQSSFVSMVAMSKHPERLEAAGVKAMVAVQPIALDLFLSRFGLPEFVVRRTSQKAVEQGATAYEDQDPLLYAGDVIVPVMLVQSLDDPWSDIAYSQALFDAFPTEKEVLWLEDAPHRADAYNWFNDHPEPLVAFFDRHLGSE